MFNIVLFQPKIPPNTGNIVRLCKNTGSKLHLIKPLGFEISENGTCVDILECDVINGGCGDGSSSRAEGDGRPAPDGQGTATTTGKTTRPVSTAPRPTAPDRATPSDPERCTRQQRRIVGVNGQVVDSRLSCRQEGRDQAAQRGIDARTRRRAR